MLLGTFQELECFARTFLTQLLGAFEVTNLRARRGCDRQLEGSTDGSAEGMNEVWWRKRKEKVTYYEGEVKLGLQFSLTRCIPSILISDGRQEVVGDLVTERPFIRQPDTGKFEKRVECATLLVNGEGETGNVKELCSGRDVLVKVLKQ